MQLADETAHRALAYVEAVRKHGHDLTVEELDAYLFRPERRDARTKIPAIEKAVLNIQRAALAWNVSATPAESVLEWLTRLHWLRSEADRVFITSLGRAILRALEESGREEELPTEIVLDPSDELSYSRVIGAIAEAGDCALVDRYFSIDSLLDVLQGTRVQRLLVGSDHHKKGRVEALGQAVKSLRIDRPFEVRQSDEFHDRFVIPDEGPVRFIGTSLSGVGKRIAVTGRVGEPASDSIRGAFEKAWADAELVAAAAEETETDEAGDEVDGPSLEVETAATATDGDGDKSTG